MRKQIVPEPERLREVLEKNVELTPECREKFVKYYEILIEWNNKMNLTAITDPRDVALLHFADSLVGAWLIPQGARCIDVGSGAGFPGVPLKIIRPDIELTLMDSLNKRINFLDALKAELGIDAVTVHLRAEDAGRSPEYREKFDIVLSRAVAQANILAEWTLPLAKPDGLSLMYKGPLAALEMDRARNAFKALNAKAWLRAHPALWGERNIIVVQKLGETPAKYPRTYRGIVKSPL